MKYVGKDSQTSMLLKGTITGITIWSLSSAGKSFLLKIKTKKEKFQDQINHWSMMKTNDFCHLGGVRETIKTNPTVMLMREKVINLSIRQLWPKGIEGSKLKGARINILQFHNKSLNLSNLKRDESQKYTAIVII